MELPTNSMTDDQIIAYIEGFFSTKNDECGELAYRAIMESLYLNEPDRINIIAKRVREEIEGLHTCDHCGALYRFDEHPGDLSLCHETTAEYEQLDPDLVDQLS